MRLRKPRPRDGCRCSDGAPDFSVEYFADGKFPLKRNQPLIWINDGTGRFSTLKVSDFIASNSDPWSLDV